MATAAAEDVGASIGLRSRSEGFKFFFADLALQNFFYQLRPFLG
jgi:hypothetical protein